MNAVLTADRVELTSAGHTNAQLNATHRCDRCHAQAYIRTTFRMTNEEGENLQMFFCGHHANEYEPKLMPLLIEWHDERERLKEDRKKGSEN